MGFIPVFKQFGATELEFPEEIIGYHPLAVRLAAALMLRDEPVIATEAEEILKFLPFLHGWSRSVLLFLPVDPEKSQRMVAVLDRYMKCLEVAAGNNLSFRIDF